VNNVVVDIIFVQTLEQRQIKMAWTQLSTSFWFCLVKEVLARVQLQSSFLLDWFRLATGYYLNSVVDKDEQ